MHKTLIIIAEDDADDRFLLSTAFEESGYPGKLSFVENGVVLMEQLNNIVSKKSQAELPGFILLDLNMPLKDGREVLKELKSDIILKKIPVVVFTTTNNEKEVNKCYELGANTYIVKPSGFNELIKTIKQISNYWFETATIAKPVFF